MEHVALSTHELARLWLALRARGSPEAEDFRKELLRRLADRDVDYALAGYILDHHRLAGAPDAPRVHQVDFCVGQRVEDMEWCLAVAADVHAMGGLFMLSTRWAVPAFEVALPASLLPLPDHLRDVAEVYRAAIHRPDRCWGIIHGALD